MTYSKLQTLYTGVRIMENQFHDPIQTPIGVRTLRIKALTAQAIEQSIERGLSQCLIQ